MEKGLGKGPIIGWKLRLKDLRWLGRGLNSIGIRRRTMQQLELANDKNKGKGLKVGGKGP